LNSWKLENLNSWIVENLKTWKVQLFNLNSWIVEFKFQVWHICLSDTKYSNCDQVDEEDSIQYSRSMMVSLRYDCEHKGNSTTHCCSRISLTKLFILTQADCVYHLTRDITIIVGIHNRSESDQIIREVDQITIHWTGQIIVTVLNPISLRCMHQIH
jgi:hypothetical protein